MLLILKISVCLSSGAFKAPRSRSAGAERANEAPTIPKIHSLQSLRCYTLKMDAHSLQNTTPALLVM